MIAIIRISGQIEIPGDVRETLDRLRMREKYKCVLVQEKPEVFGMIEKVRNFVAYGKITRETLVELIKKRGKIAGDRKKEIQTIKPEMAEKIADELLNSKIEKKIAELGLKPFFSLHPPRGGINSKKHFPKGVLGDNKEKINELIRRML